jgi:hypothetical protein
MNTEARDPILRGLDELAGLTDQVPATDRMAGITRKARTNRRRKVGAGVAGLAVSAAGAFGTAQLLSDGNGSAGPGFADDPPPPAASGLTIDLTVEPIGPKTLGVEYRIHGTSTAWTNPDNQQPMDYSGPAYTSVLLDGEAVSGSDGGDMQCRSDAPEIAFDETWSSEGGAGMPVRVPGPGTYTVTVEAPYCGADGQVVANEVSTTVTVDGG